MPTTAQFQAWGMDPTWSRSIEVPGRDGVTHTWHVLDSAGGTPHREVLATIVCVHGNPTWSVLWRSVLARLGDRYRVVAVDQLGMGYSERTGRRRFAQRVDDLDDVIEALAIDGPIVTVAHDWGGPIALGWVLRNQQRVRGVVLSNTGVAVPSGRRPPAVIRLAATGPITALVGHWTTAFVDGTLALSGRRISRVARSAYRAPYRRAEFRRAIADFVDDIPFSPLHPSAAEIAAVAERIHTIDVPVLLAWGSRDPVFNDDFALDLAERLPAADRHRFCGVGHLAVEEADFAGLLDQWLDERVVTVTSLPPLPAT
ncbi:MAG: alpha/beta fold hydrolase, partial [Ilumatobacteraceae bacterium]